MEKNVILTKQFVNIDKYCGLINARKNCRENNEKKKIVKIKTHLRYYLLSFAHTRQLSRKLFLTS